MIQGIERMEARYCEQVTRRAAQGLREGQADPGDAAVQVGGQVVLPPGDAAVPSAGPSAAVQGRLPPVPMDEEDSQPSSMGSLSPEDYAAVEGAQGQLDDESLLASEGGPDHSMLSNSERKKALAAARAAERKRLQAQKRRAEKAARIGNGVPANRGRTPTRGNHGGRRGGGSRAVPVLEIDPHPAPVSRPPLPSQEVFPLLHRAMSLSRRSASSPPATQQQSEQPAQSTAGMNRSGPQHNGEAGGSSDSLEVMVAEEEEAAVVARRQEGAESVGLHPVPGQEAAQVAGQPLVPARHLSLPSQDLQLASLQVRLTWVLPWCLCYSDFLFRSWV